MALCFACKKNFSAVSYERKTNKGIFKEEYCLECYEKLFVSLHADGHEDGKQYDVCPYCGTSAETVQRTALVGCARCYHTLGAVAIPMVIRMQQGQDIHRGKSVPQDGKTYYETRKKELLALLMYFENLGDEQRVEQYKTELEQLARGVGGKHGR